MCVKFPLKYLLFSIILLQLGCSGKDKTVERPAYLMDEDTFISILIELHLADAVIEIEKTPKDSAMIRVAAFQKQTLKSHDVTLLEYEKTFKYYKDNPERFEKLY
ncbi:MAG: DUF4296 domain-containing protein, partial [Chitinophagales bacterium]|nr:DUF4296 domain-containing protein [Chitinophagales bacterium]